MSPRLRGAELAGPARVHLDPDLVTLLRDVADAVQLVRACVDPVIFYPSINFKTDQFGEPGRTFCWRMCSEHLSPRTLSCSLKCQCNVNVLYRYRNIAYHLPDFCCQCILPSASS